LDSNAPWSPPTTPWPDLAAAKVYAFASADYPGAAESLIFDSDGTTAVGAFVFDPGSTIADDRVHFHRQGLPDSHRAEFDRKHRYRHQRTGLIVGRTRTWRACCAACGQWRHSAA
jgi:hypothetical protein